LTITYLKLQQANDPDGVGFEALHSVYRDYDAFLTSGAAANGFVLNTTDPREAETTLTQIRSSAPHSLKPVYLVYPLEARSMPRSLGVARKSRRN
jgi:hypothetical protein